MVIVVVVWGMGRDAVPGNEVNGLFFVRDGGAVLNDGLDYYSIDFHSELVMGCSLFSIEGCATVREESDGIVQTRL